LQHDNHPWTAHQSHQPFLCELLDIGYFETDIPDVQVCESAVSDLWRRQIDPAYRRAQLLPAEDMPTPITAESKYSAIVP
jgi:hypothetical protein